MDFAGGGDGADVDSVGGDANERAFQPVNISKSVKMEGLRRRTVFLMQGVDVARALAGHGGELQGEGGPFCVFWAGEGEDCFIILFVSLFFFFSC